MGDFDRIDEFRDIATAPGDMPAEALARRYAVHRYQFRHDNTLQPNEPGPGESVMVTALAGSGVNVVSARVEYTTDGSVPTEGAARVEMRACEVEYVPFGDYVRSWRGSIPGQEPATVVRYRICGESADGRSFHAQDGQGFWFRYGPDQGVTTFAYYVSDRRSEPDWFRDAVIYHVFVDRFRRGSGEFDKGAGMQEKHGGDLPGVTRSLPYLEELGITCIWLSPINPAPSYHRYNATDLFAIDPVLGTEDDLRELTAQARRRGMRVILDFVPSHVSTSHPAFISALESEDSDTHDWFVFYEWPDRYRTFLEAKLPLVSINTNSPGAREHIIASARHWVECGISGFRLDHVIGHGMDFWVEFRAALETAGAEIITIGEATDTGDALKRYRGRLSSILDFPLARALRLTFASGQWSLGHLDGFLENYERYMDDGPARVTFLDNHDMDRFLFVAGQDTAALKLATLCLMTLPDTPVVYYGTEIGMTHEYPLRDRERGGDALARQDMPWDSRGWDAGLLSFYRRVICLRREYGIPGSAGRKRVHLDSERGVYAYSISVPAGELLVSFNLSAEVRDIPARAARVLLSTGADPVVNEASIRLPPGTGCVVLPGPNA